MASTKLYIQVALVACLLITCSEQCNVGLGNLGFGNVGVGNMGLFNKGVLNNGFRNIGALNRKTANVIGVGNFMRMNRIGVANVIGVPKPGRRK